MLAKPILEIFHRREIGFLLGDGLLQFIHSFQGGGCFGLHLAFELDKDQLEFLHLGACKGRMDFRARLNNIFPDGGLPADIPIKRGPDALMWFCVGARRIVPF